MPGRGPQTFKKRQKEQQRKERQQEKMEKRLRRKEQGPAEVLYEAGNPMLGPDGKALALEPEALPPTGDANQP